MDSKVDLPEAAQPPVVREVRFFDNTTPPHLITLVFAAATAALSTNLFLPSLPGMAVYFNTDYSVIQLTVSLYLASQAILQLGIGPASDRFGRRPVMLFGFTIFVLSTLVAIWAPNIETLLVCRLLQAFAASGMVLSRAIVSDTAKPADAASRLGYVMMGMTIAPMIGPMIGGFLDEIYGWQASFILMAAFGALTMLIVYKDLGETNPYPSSSMTAQLKAYPDVMKSRRFWGYAMTAAFSSGSFFAFIGGGPFVSTEILGLSPTIYGIYFGTISIGYALGNLIASRYSRRVGINRMMQYGNIIGLISILVSIGLFMLDFNHPMSLFGPVTILGIGNGMTLPNAAIGMVSIRPRLAGSASGLGGSIQIAGGAALSVLAGLFLSKETGPYPLLIIMTGALFMAILATAYVVYVAKKAGDI